MLDLKVTHFETALEISCMQRWALFACVITGVGTQNLSHLVRIVCS